LLFYFIVGLYLAFFVTIVYPKMTYSDKLKVGIDNDCLIIKVHIAWWFLC